LKKIECKLCADFFVRQMHACLVLLLAMAVAEAINPEASKRAETLRNIELLSRRSALDKNFMRFGRGGTGDNYLR